MTMCATLLVGATVANLLSNGGFEARDDPQAGWNVPADGFWRIEEKTGVGGSRCLVWDAPEQCPKTLAAATVPAEPGCIYTVRCRVNQDSLASGEWSMGADWMAADGTWIASTSLAKRTDNHPSVAQGWVKREGGTPPLPANAATLRVYCYAKKGASGRVRFDDFAIEKSGSRAVEYLVSSVYRDTANEGDVTFCARVCFNPLKHRASDLHGAFAFTGADGVRKVRTAPLADAESVLLKLDVGDLAVGRQTVAFSLVAKDGETLGSDSLDFTREVTPVRRRVTVDRQGFAVVEGRRFFPIGVYTHFMTPEQFDFYARGPFNCVKLSNHGCSQAYLDAFWKRGLRVVVDIRDEIKVITADESEDKSRGRAALEKAIRAWKDHPAVLGWYNNDEAPLSILPDIRLATKWAHEIDPDHPTVAVTDKPLHARPFLATYDIIAMDPYPVGNLGGNGDIGIASRWTEVCRRGMYGWRGLWQVPQMFDWRWYANGAQADAETRLPTKAEFASMCWQAIAGGANGLFGYSFYDFYARQTPAERDRVWKDYCEVLAKIRKMEPLLVSDPSPVAVTNVPESLAVRAWRRNGQDWILFANRTYGPVSATVTTGGQDLQVDLQGLRCSIVKLSKSE